MANANALIVNYFKESRDELTKVTWPTRQETIQLTVVVIGVSAALALFMGSIDYLFTQVLERLLKLA